jgi:methyl coenzyme M reductase subunit D
MFVIGLIATILGMTVGAPVLIYYTYKNAKEKRAHEIEKLKHQEKVLELEIKKGNINIKLLEEENRKLDKIINEN